jgi:methyl-accepting chemotaxis protein
MTTILIVLVAITILANIVIVVYFMRKKSAEEPLKDDTALKLILEQMNEISRTVDRKVGDLTKTVDHKMNESSKNMQDSMRVQLTESSKLIREVTQGLTKLDETNKQVVSFADQLFAVFGFDGLP